MKEKVFYRIIMAAAFVLTVCSLLTHNDWILLLTAIFMACCVIITFIKSDTTQLLRTQFRFDEEHSISNGRDGRTTCCMYVLA